MTEEQFKDTFSALTEERQALVLAAYAHELTILTREGYEAGTESVRDPLLLRRLNEVQHRVTSAILSRLKKTKDRYPDDVLLNIIAGSDGGLGKRLRFCFGEALKSALAERVSQ